MVDASLIDLDVSVMGRAVELEQVFVNVIRNAVESKEHGARVTIQLAADPDVARVIVSDDGRGMTDEQQARIFEPFFTARPNRGGTGLGMSIAHGIVARHGGVIRVFSKLHKGTTVVVCLPRRLV
jgi:signal transduction histidine kinase